MGEALEKARRARVAARELAQTSSQQRRDALGRMADALVARAAEILAANEADMDAARDKGTPGPLLDRLMLSRERIDGIADGLRQVAAQPEVLGEVLEGSELYNGLRMIKYRVPLGVVAMIYEARPNVTADAAGLCIKTGNACILRGGSEAIRSNCAIMDALQEAAAAAGLPEGAVALVRDPSRAAANELMRLNGLVDVLIPRGGEGLIRAVVENATVPVIETGTGNCHVYVDRACRNLPMAFDVTYNAKLRRVSVCNAMETLLVHREISPDFLPEMLERFRKAGVEIRGCARTKALCPWVSDATEEDWRTEYDDYILAVRIVDSLDEAIDHINTYGTRHSESILTDDVDRAQRFLDRVDAAAVYLNAPTSFTDGGEFGFGAEIGISTQKLHARGPMGLNELVSYKFIIRGDGQIR